MEAQSATECSAALPACSQVETARQSEPESKDRDLALAKLWNHLVKCEVELGRWSSAERRSRQALATWQKLSGPDHTDVAVGLRNLALVFYAQGKYGEAEPILKQSLAMEQRQLGSEDPRISLTLNNLSALLTKEGKYAEAEGLSRQALALSRKLWGAEHHRIALSLVTLGTALDKQGKHTEAESELRQALAMRRKIRGTEHTEVAESLSQLADALEGQGKYAEAEKAHREALAMRQRLSGPEHNTVAETLNNLGNVLLRQGKYGEAELLYRQGLSLRRKLLGNQHPMVAAVLNNLAIILLKLGKYAEAESLCREALSVQQQFYGSEHPDLLTALGNLAVVLKHQGKYGEAEPIYLRVLALRRKTLGNEHPEVATALNNLAGVYSRQKKYAQAEAMYAEALAMRQRLSGKEHPEAVSVLSNLAFARLNQGKYEAAEEAAVQAKDIARAQLGPEHPDLALALHHLARLAFIRGRNEAAVMLLRDIGRIQETLLRATVSESRIQGLLQSLSEPKETVFGQLLANASNPAMRELGMTFALLHKGRSVEAGALANRMLHTKLSDPMVRQRYEEWQAVRKQREAMIYGAPGKQKPAEYQAKLKELEILSGSLEAQLALVLPEIRSMQPPAFDEIRSAVASRLPKSGILVEVIWTRTYQPRGQGVTDEASRWGEPHLIALLLFPDKHVASLDLGPASVIDDLSHNLLAVLRNAGADPLPAAQALYRQILAPLSPHLAGRTDVYLSLDGSLNMVPFDALHDGTEYLLGRYRLHYLTSGRDLLRQASQRKPAPPMILANPDFGKPDSQSLGDPPNFYQQFASLPPLAAAQVEAEQIASLVGTRPLLGTSAREDAIREAHAPWFLHIATHGLFLGDVDLPLSSDSRSSLLLVSPNKAQPPAGKEAASVRGKLPGEAGAMNRSALALANVRQGHLAESTQSDGLLTAQEVRSLDLDGTQLVVLSACETGQGAMSAGQGVYGLRRAFVVAGAETLVSSLWRVHDEATSELMTAYYRKLLDKRLPGDRLGAMLEAMQELRARPGRSHPYYWAPFLVIGQDGPLRGEQERAQGQR